MNLVEFCREEVERRHNRSVRTELEMLHDVGVLNGVPNVDMDGVRNVTHLTRNVCRFARKLQAAGQNILSAVSTENVRWKSGWFTDQRDLRVGGFDKTSVHVGRILRTN